MFTGLIEEIGTVKRAERSGEGFLLSVSAAKVVEGTRTGDSINVDGACQTVMSVENDSFRVFCSRVTAEVTTLASFTAGRRVNLERALAVHSRLGGHFVQGHVDGRGAVRNAARDKTGLALSIEAPAGLLRYIVPRGSVAVDGISLTVVSVGRFAFDLYLIPETMAATTLPERRPGDEVNIEVDILAKYVERMLGSGGGPHAGNDDRLREKLLEEGYL
jgi:riboflavin synthase